MPRASARVWPRFAPDDRLVALVRRGELTAFEILYDRHAGELLAFCSYILDSRYDAEDAVQSTFASAYKALMADQRPVALRPWLFAIARNASLSILRTRRPTLEIHEVPARGEDPALRAEQRESLRLLVATMLELPEYQRTALVLAELHGLSHGEIGTVLNVPSERVKAYIYQARSNLASERVARGTDCAEIRQELSSARGPALLKARLRRHLRSCEGCRDFAAELSRRRGQLGILIPVAPTLALKRRVLDAASGNAGGAGAGGSAVGASLAVTSADLAGVGVKALVAKVLVAVAGAAGVAGVGIGAGAGTLALSAVATNGQDRGVYIKRAQARAGADAAAGRDVGASDQPVGAGPSTSAQGVVASTATGRSQKPTSIDRGPRAVGGAAVAGAPTHGKSGEAAGRGLGSGKSGEAHGKSVEAHSKSVEAHGKSAEAHGSGGLRGASGEAHRRGSPASGSTGAPGKSAEARGNATPHGTGGPSHSSVTAMRQAPAALQSSGAAGGGAAVASGNPANAGNEPHGTESHANASGGAQGLGKGASSSPSPAAGAAEAGAAGHNGGEGAASESGNAAPAGHAQTR